MAFELPRDNMVSPCCSLSRTMQVVNEVSVTSYCLAQPADVLTYVDLTTFVTSKIAFKWALFSVTQNVTSYLLHYLSKTSVTDEFGITYCCVLRILPELHSFSPTYFILPFFFYFLSLWHSLCLFLRRFAFYYFCLLICPWCSIYFSHSFCLLSCVVLHSIKPLSSISMCTRINVWVY